MTIGPAYADQPNIRGLTSEQIEAVDTTYKEVNVDVIAVAGAMNGNLTCPSFGGLCDAVGGQEPAEDYVCTVWSDLLDAIPLEDVEFHAYQYLDKLGADLSIDTDPILAHAAAADMKFFDLDVCKPDFQFCLDKCKTAACIGSCFTTGKPSDGDCTTHAICLSQNVCGNGLIPFFEVLGF